MAQTATRYINLDMPDNVKKLMASGYKYLIFGRQLPHSLVVGTKRFLDYGDYVFREVIPCKSKPKDDLKSGWECYTMSEVAKKKLLHSVAYSFQVAENFLEAA